MLPRSGLPCSRSVRSVSEDSLSSRRLQHDSTARFIALHLLRCRGTLEPNMLIATVITSCSCELHPQCTKRGARSDFRGSGHRRLMKCNQVENQMKALTMVSFLAIVTSSSVCAQRTAESLP